MTHPTYTQQALSRYNLPRLKRIATELGVTPTGDKRATETWVNAIITHQSTQLQKVDNQALAQAELDHFIADQAQAIAPEPLTIVEISFSDYEYYAGNQLVASISHDDNLTQPWVVMVNGTEKFRANTWARCNRFIEWHLNNSQLPSRNSQLNSISKSKKPCTCNNSITNYLHNCELRTANCELLDEPVPTQTEVEETATTGNEIIVQIFNECEKYGFEILDDGIYQNNVKLGEAGCTDGGWWVMRTGECQQMPCDSAMEAVRRLCPSQTSLSMVDVLPTAEVADCEELLDRPFEMLTALDWELLREYAPVAESRELVTA